MCVHRALFSLLSAPRYLCAVDDNVRLMTTFSRASRRTLQRVGPGPRPLNYLSAEIANQMRVGGCRWDSPDTVRRGETETAIGHLPCDGMVLGYGLGWTRWYSDSMKSGRLLLSSSIPQSEYRRK